MTRSSWLDTSRLLWKEGATKCLEQRNCSPWGVAGEYSRHPRPTDQLLRYGRGTRTVRGCFPTSTPMSRWGSTSFHAGAARKLCAICAVRWSAGDGSRHCSPAQSEVSTTARMRAGSSTASTAKCSTTHPPLRTRDEEATRWQRMSRCTRRTKTSRACLIGSFSTSTTMRSIGRSTAGPDSLPLGPWADPMSCICITSPRCTPRSATCGPVCR